MQQKILHFLKTHPTKSYKPRDLSREMAIPAEERRDFRRLLKYLAQKNSIVRLKGGRYVFREETELTRGVLKMHYQGYGFVIPEDPKETDIFIPARRMGQALPMDIVHAEILAVDKNGRREGRIIDIVKRGRSIWVGCLIKKGSQYFAINEEFASELPIRVHSQAIRQAYLGQNVAVRLDETADLADGLSGELVQVLGFPFEEKTEVLAICLRHQIPQEFPAEVLEAVKQMDESQLTKISAGRVDLRQKPFMTIDGLTAKDFDDAIFVEKIGRNYRLYVSIADVAHFVAPDQPIDCEAQSRGTSTYFPDFVVPMLPQKLSNELCSLKPGQDRLTMTCELELDPKGQLKSAHYYQSVIHSQKRGIYEEVQNYFDKDSCVEEIYSPGVKQSLQAQQELAHILMKARQRRGALDFDLPEAEIVYDHEGKIAAIVQAKRFFSHKLIEEFMIAANCAVAALFEKLAIPIPYRIHDKPDPTKMKEFMDLVHNLGITANFDPNDAQEVSRFLHEISDHPLEGLLHQVLLRSMRVAVYTTDNRGHFGLNLSQYCHFTSPIRRYPDLMVHRQLKALLAQAKTQKISLLEASPADGFQPGLTMGEVKKLSRQSSLRERESMEAEREMLDYKRTVFMQDHLGEEFFGRIRRINNSGLFVELDPHCVSGFLHVKELKDDYYTYDEKKIRFVGKRKRRVYGVGDRLPVRVKDVTLASRTIFLELV